MLCSSLWRTSWNDPASFGRGEPPAPSRPFRCRGGGAEARWQGVNGSYWCNRIYLEALRWANEKGSVPVAFVHVPALIGESLPLYGRHVAALYKRFTGEVLAILDQMEQDPTGGAGSQ
jgi:hypothetical protein